MSYDILHEIKVKHILIFCLSGGKHVFFYSEEVTKIMMNKGMNARELINASGISSRTLESILKGKAITGHNSKTVYRVATALGVKPENIAKYK